MKRLHTKSKTRWGTSNFVSFNAATKYYSNQGENEAAVKRKIAENLISIGVPVLKKGQTCGIIEGEGRYYIEG